MHHFQKEEIDEVLLDEYYSPTTGEKITETKENIKSTQRIFPKIQAEPSKPVIVIRSSILSDQQSSEKVMKLISPPYLLKPSLSSSSSTQTNNITPIDCSNVPQDFYKCSSSKNQDTKEVISRCIMYESNEDTKTLVGQLIDPERKSEHVKSQGIHNLDLPTNEKLKLAKIIEDKKENQEDENITPRSAENISELEVGGNEIGSRSDSFSSSASSIPSTSTSHSENQITINQEYSQMVDLKLTVFNDKVNLLDTIFKIDGGKEICNTIKRGAENKDIKQGLTRILGNILMEDCSNPGNPSPEEKREVVSIFCKLMKRPDMEVSSQLI